MASNPVLQMGPNLRKILVEITLNASAVQTQQCLSHLEVKLKLTLRLKTSDALEVIAKLQKDRSFFTLLFCLVFFSPGFKHKVQCFLLTLQLSVSFFSTFFVLLHKKSS